MTGFFVSLLMGAATVVLGLPSGRSMRGDLPSGGAADHGGIRGAPLILDLLAAMLTAGASVEHALSVVGRSCDLHTGSSLQRVHAARLLGAPWEAAWNSGREVRQDPSVREGPGRRGTRMAASRKRDIAEVEQGLRFATATGAPSAALLHAHAAQLRRRHNRETERRAAALGVQLVLPLGLCSLPAFICLGVVPVVLGLLPDL